MEKTQLQNYHVHYGPAQGWSRVDPVSYTHLDVYKRQYLPYYNCNTVYDAVTRAGFAVERYPLDARRLPVCPALGDGE